MKIQKKKIWGGGGSGEGSGLGGQGGCDRRIEKFLGKFTKKKIQVGGSVCGGGGFRVDVNEELKFLCKFKKKYFFLGGGGGVVKIQFFLGGPGGGRGLVGGSGSM